MAHNPNRCAALRRQCTTMNHDDGIINANSLELSCILSIFSSLSQRLEFETKAFSMKLAIK